MFDCAVARRVLQRIDAMTGTTQRIMAGDLSGRLPVGRSGDELDRLSQSLNLMLSRIEQLMAQIDSKFTLVTLSAMRAREINDYYNQLGEGLGKIVPPQVTSVSRKPLTISLEEIEAGKIRAIPKPPEEDAEAEAEAALLTDAGDPDQA